MKSLKSILQEVASSPKQYVLPKNILLNHNYSFIEVKDEEEKSQVISWAKSQGKNTDGIKDIRKFPLYLSVAGKNMGWTDLPDRSAYYIRFKDFINHVSEN